MALAVGVFGSGQILKPLIEGVRDQMEIHTQNGQIMNDFINQRINMDKTITTAEEVISGHHKLIIDSNAFLPKENQTMLPLEKKPLDIENAISLITKIKDHFQNEDHIYSSFLNSLCSKTFEELCREVAAICQDHPDLLEEFDYFISSHSSSTSVSEGSSFPLQSGRGCVVPSMRLPWMLKAVKMCMRPEFNQAVNLTEHEYDQKKGHKRKKNKIKDRRHMIVDDADYFKVNLVSDSSFADKDTGKKLYLKEGLKTFTIMGKRTKREKKLKMDDGDNFKINLISDSSFADKDAELCLKEGLKSFTVKGKRKKRVKKLKWDEADNNFEKESYIKRERKRTYIQCASTDVANQKICSTPCKENDDFKKSISELDLSKCQRCTPNYCLLSKEYMRPTTYCKSDIAASVLNDACILVPSTSDHSVPSSNDHSSSRKKQKTEPGEKLDQLEDDLFELDLLLALVKGTISQVEELQDKLNNNAFKIVLPFHLESCFTTANLKCIERLYGALGLDALNALSQNIECALPAVFTRLKQKQEEWSRCRANIGRCC